MYNVFCYAGDIMVMGLTATGLQRRIDTANDYILNRDLLSNNNMAIPRKHVYRDILQTSATYMKTLKTS